MHVASGAADHPLAQARLAPDGVQELDVADSSQEAPLLSFMTAMRSLLADVAPHLSDEWSAPNADGCKSADG